MKKKPVGKNEIINKITERSGLKRADVSAFLTHYHEVIVEIFAKDELFVIPQLVKLFSMVKPGRPQREGVNPFTKEKMYFKARPPRKYLRVRYLKRLKDVVAPLNPNDYPIPEDKTQ